MTEAMLVIYVSETGRDKWLPVLPDDVPAWIKAPKVMGRLVAGEMCIDPRSETEHRWFRAEKVH